MGKAIGGRFGQRALGPLYEHLSVVGQTVEQLSLLFDALLAGDMGELTRTADEIDRLEHQADQVKKSIRGRLSESVFAAVQRAEIMQLLKAQDDIADRCQAVGRLARVRRMACPAAPAQVLQRLLRHLVVTGERLVLVVREANEDAAPHEAFERGMLAIMDSDEVPHELVQEYLVALFQVEPQADPISVILLMRLGEQLGRVADKLVNTAEIYHRAGLEAS